MRFVPEPPESVMESVGTHFDHREEIPILGLNQMACEFETFGGHFEELLFQLSASILFGSSEYLSCNRWRPDRFPATTAAGKSTVRITVRREETGEPSNLEMAWRDR